MADLDKYKQLLIQYLEFNSIEINDRIRPPRVRCPNPDHSDENPSAILYNKSNTVYCPVCQQTWDIFGTAGILHGLKEFIDQLNHIKKWCGEEKIKPKEVKKTNKKNNQNKNLKILTIEEARMVFNEEALNKISTDRNWGAIGGVWPYLDESGKVKIVDVRFDRGKEKSIISLWYDGSQIHTSGCPNTIYGLDQIHAQKDKPILIVEGAKTADAAKQMSEFIPVTWNGGSNKVNKIDWTVLKDRDVYILPDDDRIMDQKTGKVLSKEKQPGYKAALAIQEQIKSAKIVWPLPREARKIKKSGADVVEYLQIMTSEQLTNYILNNAKVKEETKIILPKKNGLPFRIFGIADDQQCYFRDRHSRVLTTTLSTLTRTQLMNLADFDYWREHFAIKGQIQWDEAFNFIIKVSGDYEFDSNLIRGRGAWKEKDGSICYHDGRTTIGNPDPERWYIRRRQKSIGLGTPVPSLVERSEMLKAICDLSFEHMTDALRAIGWCTLGPFAGALPWRPAALLTGESESGKSTILDYVIRPLCLPETFSGGGTTEAGIRQAITNDAYPVVIEELEADNIKKQMNRESIFSLMRQSTSDFAPRIQKGTRNQKGLYFIMRSMFLFIAIDPVIQHVADDNRIIRINLKQPDKPFPPVFDNLKKWITPYRCAGIRSHTWNNLSLIIDRAKDIQQIVQSVTNWSPRNAFAQSLLISAILIVWQDMTSDYEEEVKRLAVTFEACDHYDQNRNTADEVVQRILDERIIVSPGNWKTVREMLIDCDRMKALKLKEEESEVIVQHYKNTLAQHGIASFGNDLIGIANGHHEIMRITNMKAGYQRLLRRHPNVENDCKITRLAGKSCRVTTFRGLLGTTEPEQKEMEF